MFEIVEKLSPLLLIGALVGVYLVSTRKPDPMRNIGRSGAATAGSNAPAWLRYAAVALLVAGVFLVLPVINQNAEAAKMAMPIYAASRIGAACVPVLIGLLGLFYRPARFEAFCIITFVATAALLYGETLPH